MINSYVDYSLLKIEDHMNELHVDCVNIEKKLTQLIQP